MNVWAALHQPIMERTCESSLRETDLSDDHLEIVLRRLSNVETWSSLESSLS